jgi:hypothetical protein
MAVRPGLRLVAVLAVRVILKPNRSDAIVLFLISLSIRA